MNKSTVHGSSSIQKRLGPITSILLVSLVLLCNSASIYAVTFDWATVGNPGNLDDNKDAAEFGGEFGSVDYTFRISKHEVNNAQYTEFLNAVAATDTNNLYSSLMSIGTQGGIIRGGIEGIYSYAVKEDVLGEGPGGGPYTYADKPVNNVSFLDALRFANWLENGQPSGMQNETTTEKGSYDLSIGNDGVREQSAKFFIPNYDEWYKAAYHKNDGVTGNFWDYPTSSDSVPNNNLPSDDTGNSANFVDGEFTTGSAAYPLTDVGAYSQSVSSYGTFDQGGNVAEWTESSLPNFGIPTGGMWHKPSGRLKANTGLLLSVEASYQDSGLGFRVANIPEPTTSALALAALCLVVSRCRSF